MREQGSDGQYTAASTGFMMAGLLRGRTSAWRFPAIVKDDMLASDIAIVPSWRASIRQNVTRCMSLTEARRYRYQRDGNDWLAMALTSLCHPPFLCCASVAISVVA